MTPASSLRLVAISLAAVLTACAVGPDFRRPDPPAPGPFTPPEAPLPATLGAQRFSSGEEVRTDWWRAFGSPALDGLVAESLRANTDLAAATSALRSARETYLAQKGVLLPAVAASVSASRAKSSQYLSPVLNAQAFYYRLQTAELDISYTLDLFGGLRRQVEGAKAQAEAQYFQTEAVRLNLVSGVVVAAVSEAALVREVAEAEKIVEVETKLLVELREAQRLGQVSRADVLVQEGLLGQALAAVPPLKKELAVERDLLAYLTGRTPGAGGVVRVDLATLTLPADLPLSLPAAVVARRPDVRVAESNLHVASAALGQAIAARLPSLTLSAGGGGSAAAWSNLFRSGYDFWSYGGAIAQPLFQGGALRRRQKAAEAMLDQAKSLYRSAVLSAFQNIADVLQALETDAAAVRAAQAEEDAARDALSIARVQVAEGQSPGIAGLAAEQVLEVARGALLQARAAQLVDTASLFQALGGGWTSSS